MTSALTIAFILLLPAAEPDAETARKPHPFAPSLPDLTDEEEAQFDQVIDQFVLAHIGKLKGDDARKAVDALAELPPEAIFALLRGLNRAAAKETTRPATFPMGKKVAALLRRTGDAQLLDFARENIGAREN